MKAIQYILAATAVCALTTSCGVSDRYDDVKDLADDKDEWTADQTNKAIDIYIEGLKDQADMYEEIVLIQQKMYLDGDWETKGKKSIVKERKDDIKEAKKKLKDKQKEIKKKYEDDDND